MKIEHVLAEGGEVGSARLIALQEQVNRLDPANKSLLFSKFTSVSASGRDANIQAFLQSITESTPVQIEHPEIAVCLLVPSWNFLVEMCARRF